MPTRQASRKATNKTAINKTATNTPAKKGSLTMATRKTPTPPAPNTTSLQASANDATAVALRTVRAVARGNTAAARGGPDLSSELNNIDFQKMIGGPLQAAVDAQVKSSLATVNFINEVGFTKDATTGKKELVMVDFSHSRKDVNDKGTEVVTNVAVRVPLLAMLPIPSLRIEHVIIDFNVKLNSVETSSVSDKFDIAAEVGGGIGPVKFKVSAAYQRQSATGMEIKKEYALNVNVKAIQDEIPAGLEKILNMLAA